MRLEHNWWRTPSLGNQDRYCTKLPTDMNGDVILTAIYYDGPKDDCVSMFIQGRDYDGLLTNRAIFKDIVMHPGLFLEATLALNALTGPHKLFVMSRTIRPWNELHICATPAPREQTWAGFAKKYLVESARETTKAQTPTQDTQEKKMTEESRSYHTLATVKGPEQGMVLLDCAKLPYDALVVEMGVRTPCGLFIPVEGPDVLRKGSYRALELISFPGQGPNELVARAMNPKENVYVKRVKGSFISHLHPESKPRAWQSLGEAVQETRSAVKGLEDELDKLFRTLIESCRDKEIDNLRANAEALQAMSQNVLGKRLL